MHEGANLAVMHQEDDFDLRGEAEQASDGDLDRVLRPARFEDFTGQRAAMDNLQVFVMAAKQRSEALDHVLLHGPPGLGKTTLANIVAESIDSAVWQTEGAVAAAGTAVIFAEFTVRLTNSSVERFEASAAPAIKCYSDIGASAG